MWPPFFARLHKPPFLQCPINLMWLPLTAPRRFLCTPALLQLSNLCDATNKSVCTRALLQLSSDLPEPQGDSRAHEPCCSSQTSAKPQASRCAHEPCCSSNSSELFRAPQSSSKLFKALQSSTNSLCRQLLSPVGKLRLKEVRV